MVRFNILRDVFREIILRIKALPAGKHTVGHIKIHVPPQYGPKIFQQKFKLYDRFLPVLVSTFSDKGTIVDVGGNTGITSIAIVQQCRNKIICVEASDYFFEYIQKNLSLLSQEEVNRVKVIKKFAGTGKYSGDLQHASHGTASLKVTQTGNSNTITIDQLVNEENEVILLKSDTDGFDFDVLLSAENTLGKKQPILYWENEISEDFQLTGYNELYYLLEKMNYKYIFLFDNFGNLITEECSFQTLKNINEYVYSMKKYMCTRTIYYTDVLASTERNIDVVRKAIELYKTNWIKR